MVNEAVKAEKMLAEKGIDAGIIDIHTIKPLDTDTILREVKVSKAIVTAENHSIINGLGSAVSEFICENYPVPVKRVGVKDHFGEVGMQDFLAEKYGLTAENIVKNCIEIIKMKEN